MNSKKAQRVIRASARMSENARQIAENARMMLHRADTEEMQDWQREGLRYTAKRMQDEATRKEAEANRIYMKSAR